MVKRLLPLALASCLLLAGSTPARAVAPWRPLPGTSWQIQFTGRYNPNLNVSVYDIDGFDHSAREVAALRAKGRHVICYIDAGTWEDWRPDASKFPSSVKGKSNGWPGERWLDIRKLSVIGPVLRARIAMCHDKGFHAVDFDNVDSYSNDTGFPISASYQIAFNKWLAREAHARGLGVGLKNDISQIGALQPFFDFAINESCFQFNECGPYSSFVRAHKAVFQIEYTKPMPSYCGSARAMHLSAIKKHSNLDAARWTCGT